MKKIIIAVLLVVFMICCGCTDSEINTENSSVNINDVTSETGEIFAMDTYMTIKVFGYNAKDCIEKSQKEIKYLEKIFSVTNSESDISKINSNSGNFIEVSEDTVNLIEKANQISDLTDGSVDISIYPVLKEWGFTTGEYKVPKQSNIQNLLKNVDYKKISIDGNKVKVPENFAIDLGSVAKGYTGDKICEILKAEGIKSALINLGGNVQTLGTKPDGSKWNVALQDPTKENKEVCIVKLSDKAMITSGSYERYFTDNDGKRYWHIIDPSTGSPADKGLLSATIIGESGTMCDSLSTALFVMGEEEAKQFAKNHNEIDVILINNNMEIFITKGIEENIEMLDGHTYKLIN